MIRLRSLGQCVIEVGDTRLTPSAEVMFAMVLYLLLEAGRPVGRGELTGLIWPDLDERRAQQCLRQALYRFRAMGAKVRCEQAHVLVPHRSYRSDCGELLAAPESADLEPLADAVLGSFLPGYSPHFSAPFADWLERQRDLVHSALRRILVGGITAKKERGEWQAAQLLAARCLALDPLNEEATLVIAEAAALNGSKVQALSILDKYLKEIGPEAHDIRLPATVLRRRIAELHQGEIRPPWQIPQVGREAEMAELTRALASAGERRGSAYLIWGEPGIGKTRLVTELTRAAELQRVQIARVGCQSHDARRPLSAFVDLVPRLLELRGSLGASPDSMKYLRRLVAHDPYDTTLSPDSRESELLFSNIRRSLVDLLDAIASEGRLILVIEDVHWLDRMSWELLRDVVPWLATKQSLLLLTSRVVDVADRLSTGQQTGLVTLHMVPLRDASSLDLLQRVTTATGREGHREFLEWCVESAGGNPYYLTELALHATWDGTHYRAPATLGKLIAGRLSRLGTFSKRVLQACCILGKLSSLERLERVLGEKRIALLGALDELTIQGLVEPDGPGVKYKHDLLAQAALAQMSQLSRALLHRHAAEMLEGEIRSSNSTAAIWECAEHWERAGERERAVALLKACAHHSIEMGVPTEAVTLLEHALSLTSDAAESLELAQDQVRALHLADYWEQLPSTIEALGRLRQQASAQFSHHTSDELLAIEAEWRLGSEMNELYARVKGCVRSEDASREHRVRAATLALILADNLCTHEDVEEVYATVAPFLDDEDIDGSARAYLRMVYCCSFGDVTKAPAAADELVAFARADGNAARVSRGLRHASIAYAVAGQLVAAEKAAIEAFYLAGRMQLEYAASAAAARLVAIYKNAGRMSDAEHWYGQAIARPRELVGALERSILAGHGAILALHRGEFDQAEQLIEAAEQKLRESASLRSRAENAALRMSLQLSRSQEAPTDDSLKELLEMHYQSRSFVWHDFVALILFRALDAKGLHGHRALLAAEYKTRYRREHSPLLAELNDYLNAQA